MDLDGLAGLILAILSPEQRLGLLPANSCLKYFFQTLHRHIQPSHTLTLLLATGMPASKTFPGRHLGEQSPLKAYKRGGQRLQDLLPRDVRPSGTFVLG